MVLCGGAGQAASGQKRMGWQLAVPSERADLVATD